MRLLKVVPLLLLLGTVGCGMSEGQNAVLYLGSVTVQERRIETSAHALESVIEQGEKTGKIDEQALLAALKDASQTNKTGKEELEKINVPNSTKPIHELYKQLFSANEKQISLTEQIVSSTDDVAKDKAKQELTEVQKQIADLSQKITEEKRKLSAQYQEVQLPEASPSTAGPQS